MSGRPGHPHLAPNRRDFVIAGDEAADAGAVDDGDPGKIEHNGPLALAQEAFDHAGDVLAVRAEHQFTGQGHDHRRRRHLFMADLKRHASDQCTSRPTEAGTLIPMSYFLAKSEPGVYSIDDLERDKRTSWDGVTNAQAVKAIRSMRPGDRVFIYHSGGESAVVGLAEVTSEARPDPNDEKCAVVDLRYLAHLEPPTTLADVKSSGLFADW